MRSCIYRQEKIAERNLTIINGSLTFEANILTKIYEYRVGEESPSSRYLPISFNRVRLRTR